MNYKNKVLPIPYEDFCKGMDKDGTELTSLGKRKWELIKTYLAARLRGDDETFTYEILAKRAVRFACIVSNTIENMREEVIQANIKEIKRKEEQERQEAEERVLMERKKVAAKAEQERQSKLTPMERYKEGLSVRYCDLDDEAKAEVYERYLKLTRYHWFPGGWKVGEVILTDSEYADFEKRKKEMIDNLPLFEKAEWGIKVDWADLSDEEHEILHKRYLAGDRYINHPRGWNFVSYHNYIIPENVIAKWRDEYAAKKKGNNHE